MELSKKKVINLAKAKYILKRSQGQWAVFQHDSIHNVWVRVMEPKLRAVALKELCNKRHEKACHLLGITPVFSSRGSFTERLKRSMEQCV